MPPSERDIREEEAHAALEAALAQRRDEDRDEEPRYLMLRLKHARALAASPAREGVDYARLKDNLETLLCFGSRETVAAIASALGMSGETDDKPLTRALLALRAQPAPVTEGMVTVGKEWLLDKRESARDERAKWVGEPLPEQGNPDQQMAYWRGYDDALGAVLARHHNLGALSRAPEGR